MRIENVGWMSVACLLLGNCCAETVSVESLLREMTDRDRLTYYPEQAYTTRLWSSYDRRSDLDRSAKNWYSNEDWSQFIRTEVVNELSTRNRSTQIRAGIQRRRGLVNLGRQEEVLLDATGPGAITRFWCTLSRSDGNGTLRVYVDGKPVIQGGILEILSGGKICGEPLSSCLPKDAPRLERGNNLYFPIPYAKSCKVTYESHSLYLDPKRPMSGGAREHLFYNIETRTYPDSVTVVPLTPDTLGKAKELTAEACRLLAAPEGPKDGKRVKLGDVVGAGKSVTVEDGAGQPSGGAIREFSLVVNEGKDDQALRTTVVEMQFDGEQTVWCPAGEFFGAGYKYAPFQTWNTRAESNGVMRCFWVMPYEKACKVTVHNFGTEEIRIAGSELVFAPYDWKPGRSMHFGTSWKELKKAKTKENGEHYIVNYATLEGTGILVGTGLYVYNKAPNWWGEGDEQIYTDGEKFPSYFGTGTEDFFGYAWCRTETFDHPFLAQPVGSRSGPTFNLRHRALDTVLFKKKLVFDMELWHWNDSGREDVDIDYAPTVSWYMLPGGKSNVPPAPEAVKTPVRTAVIQL